MIRYEQQHIEFQTLLDEIPFTLVIIIRVEELLCEILWKK